MNIGSELVRIAKSLQAKNWKLKIQFGKNGKN